MPLFLELAPHKIILLAFDINIFFMKLKKDNTSFFFFLKRSFDHMFPTSVRLGQIAKKVTTAGNRKKELPSVGQTAHIPSYPASLGNLL